MEFAIAFFGIIWLVYKYIAEKRKESNFSKNNGAYLKEWNTFTRNYEAKPDEMNLIWDAIRKNSYNGQKVTDILKEDLLYIYGSDYMKKWNTTEFSALRGMKYWAGNLLLATHGKVTSRATHEGYYFSPSNREEVRRICKRIEARLQENGVGARLYFEPRKDKSTNWVPDYDFVNSQRFVFGQDLFWEFDKNRCRVW